MDREEEITTIFVVGFPDNIHEREFQNMFTFAPGFEGSMLKFPSNEDADKEKEKEKEAENENENEAQGEKEKDKEDAPSQKKQIIGFAKFRSQIEALEARDILTGKKIDLDSNCVVKAELAKKNLYTKRGSLSLNLGSFGMEMTASMPYSSGLSVGLGGGGGLMMARPYNNFSLGDARGYSAYDRGYGYGNGHGHGHGPGHGYGHGYGYGYGYSDGSGLMSAPLRPLDMINTQSENVFMTSNAISPPNEQREGRGNINGNSRQMGGHDSLAPRSAQDNGLLGLSPTSAAGMNSSYYGSIDLMKTQSERKFGLDHIISRKGNDTQSQILSSRFKALNVNTNMISQGRVSSSGVAAGPMSATVSNTGSSSAMGSSSGPHSASSLGIQPPGLSRMDKTKSIGFNDQNPPCNTLYVGNLSVGTQESELRALFENVAGYKRMCFRTKPNSGPMCFVEFKDIEHAATALNSLNGHLLSTSITSGIRLSYSKNPLGVRSSQNPTSASASVSGSGSNAWDSLTRTSSKGARFEVSDSRVSREDINRSSKSGSPLSRMSDSSNSKLQAGISSRGTAHTHAHNNSNTSTSTGFGDEDFSIDERPTSNGTLIEQRRSFDLTKDATPNSGFSKLMGHGIESDISSHHQQRCIDN